MDARLAGSERQQGVVRLFPGTGNGNSQFVRELIGGAQRLKLEERIRRLVREVTGFRMKFEQIVALPLTDRQSAQPATWIFWATTLAPEQRRCCR